MTIVRRRSAKRTNWRHRHDALTPANKLRIKRLKAKISDLEGISEEVMMFLLGLSIYMSMNPMLTIQDPFLCFAHRILGSIHQIIDTDILRCSIELLLLEYSFDNSRSTAVFSGPKNRFINDVGNEWARVHTRFSCDQLRRLLIKWRVPDQFVVRRKGLYKASAAGETCMIVALTFLTTSTCIYRLFPGTFGGCPCKWGSLIYLFYKHIYVTFYHKICSTSMTFFINRIVKYAASVLKMMSSQAHYTETQYHDGRYQGTLSYVHVPANKQRCIGFIDNTTLDICRPGDTITIAATAEDFVDAEAIADPETIGDDDGEPDDIQRAFYSGFKKQHGLCVQTVMFPDGMVGSVFVASIRNNDNGMFNISGLGNELLHLFPLVLESDPPVRYALYGDGIFQRHTCLFNRPLNVDNPHEQAVYKRMNSMRVSIEHMYARIKVLFPMLMSRKKIKLIHKTEEVVQMVVSAFFFLNCYTCLNGSNCTIIFDEAPPTLDEYLPEGEVLIPAPVVYYSDE